MPEQEPPPHTPPIELHERPITMPDGRYMVFFTFSDSDNRDPAAAKSEESAEAGDDV